jgi:spermidine synthase
VREIIHRQSGKCGEIQLQRRSAGVYEIIYNGIFLMASYNDHSEKVLAKSAIQRLNQKVGGYHIVVGGLGMGFTLQEVLACSRVSRVVVTEIEEVIIDWNRGYFREFNGGALDDPRAVLIHSDFFDFL